MKLVCNNRIGTVPTLTAAAAAMLAGTLNLYLKCEPRLKIDKNISLYSYFY